MKPLPLPLVFGRTQKAVETKKKQTLRPSLGQRGRCSERHFLPEPHERLTGETQAAERQRSLSVPFYQQL